MKILLIGNGKWGQNYKRLIEEDYKDIKLEIANREGWHFCIQNNDAVIIATQPEYHIDIAIECIKQNKPIMIEKPLSLSYQECLKLKEICKAYNYNESKILINNQHLFSPAFEKMCEIININDIVSIESFGGGCGPYRNYSSLFDYGPHDLSMGLFLVNKNINNININNINNKNTINTFNTINTINTIKDCKYKITPIGKRYDLKLEYSINDKVIIHSITSSNIEKHKVRKFLVKTTKTEYLYDDLLENKLMVNHYPYLIDKRNTLNASFDCFINLMINDTKDKRFGLDIAIESIKIIEQIN